MNQHHIPNKIFSISQISYPQIYPCPYPQNFAMFMKQNLHMTTKFPTCIMNIFIQAHNTNFSQCQCPQNPSHNLSNDITNYQHCPSYTMIKKINTSKRLQSQHYNMINHTTPQIPTRIHNKMTMSHHQIFNET